MVGTLPLNFYLTVPRSNTEIFSLERIRVYRLDALLKILKLSIQVKMKSVMSDTERKCLNSCEENYGMEYKGDERSRRRILTISAIMIFTIITTNSLLIYFTVWSIRNPQKVMDKTIIDSHLLGNWDEIYREFPINKSRKLPENIDYFTQCDDLWNNISSLNYLHNGWSKIVYSGVYHHSSVAVKTIYFEGHDVQKCLETNTVLECYHRAAGKMLREIMLLSQINSRYILKVRAVCVPEYLSKNSVIMRNNLIVLVTELGTPINLITLLQRSLDQQLKMVSDISRLLSELTQTNLGSLTLNDLRREQFVLINNTLTLSDMDDVTREENSCINDEQCKMMNNGTNQCRDGRCRNYKNCRNLHSASIHLLKPLFTGVPATLYNYTEEIMIKSLQCLMSEEDLVENVNTLIKKFSLYSLMPDNYTVPNYTTFENASMGGYGDYTCKHSHRPFCSRTAASLDDAIYICDAEPQCLTVIISNNRTWNGRLEIILKNSSPNVENLTQSYSTTVHHLTGKFTSQNSRRGSD